MGLGWAELEIVGSGAAAEPLLAASLAPSNPSSVGLQRTEAAVSMTLLCLLQAGGTVLGQAMERVTGGNLLSTLLIACAFTLSLVYLFRLAVGHLTSLQAGAVSASRDLCVCGVGALWLNGEVL